MVKWDAKPLSAVCTIKPPKSEARANLNDSDEVSFAPMENLGIGVKFMEPSRVRQLGEVSGSYTYFADGDVLLAKITPCFENGKLGIARGLTNGIGFGSSEYVVLRPSAELSAEFLYYFLARPTFLEEGARTMAGAVGHKRITKEFVENSQIPTPSLKEQQRIVAILDEAFEGIATAKANAEKSRQNARDLQKVVVRQKLDGLSSEWSSCTIGDQITLQRGFDITKGDQRTGVIPVVSSGGIRSHHDTAMVCSPGVVMGRKGTLGKVFYMADDFWPHDTTLWVKDFKANYPRFVYRFFEALDVQHLDSGAANPSLNRNAVHAIPVSWPPLAEQIAIADQIDNLLRATKQVEVIYTRKLDLLDELKKSLLHQAFTGQL